MRIFKTIGKILMLPITLPYHYLKVIFIPAKKKKWSELPDKEQIPQLKIAITAQNIVLGSYVGVSTILAILTLIWDRGYTGYIIMHLIAAPYLLSVIYKVHKQND